MAFIFYLTREKVEGQLRPDFNVQNFLAKTVIYFSVLSQDSENVIHFHARQLVMTKLRFKSEAEKHGKHPEFHEKLDFIFIPCQPCGQ